MVNIVQMVWTQRYQMTSSDENLKMATAQVVETSMVTQSGGEEE